MDVVRLVVLLRLFSHRHSEDCIKNCVSNVQLNTIFVRRFYSHNDCIPSNEHVSMNRDRFSEP